MFAKQKADTMFDVVFRQFATIRLCLAFLSSTVSFTANAQAVRDVAICELTQNSAQYLGASRVRTTAMLTWTKEGSFLWGRNCRDRGLHLSIEFPSQAERDRTWKALRETGTWERPAVATFTGSLVKVHEHVFTMKFDAIEFRATQIENISPSETTRASWGR